MNTRQEQHTRFSPCKREQGDQEEEHMADQEGEHPEETMEDTGEEEPEIHRG